MIARWIFAGLMGAFLATFMIASGTQTSRAAETKTAIFAGGCFWCVEDAFDKVDGVTETVSGYAGGTTPSPTYRSHEGYIEALKVTYDPSKVTYAMLLDHYWRNVDPFDPIGQFCDKGHAYQTVVDVSDAGREHQERDREALQAEGGDGDYASNDLLRRGGLSPGLSQQESGGLQIL